MKNSLIHYIYRKRDEFGNRVRGHESRCYALQQAFSRLGYSVTRDPDQADVIICDGVENYSFDALVVSIVDVPGQAIFGHVNISPSFYQHRILDLHGPRYTIIRDELRDHWGKSRKNVLIVPGGNHESFWKQVDSGVIEICLQRGYEVTKMFDEDKTVAATRIISADLVICPASVTALEAASIGKPLLLIQTADDQRHNYDGLVKHFCGLPYSEKNLKYLLQAEKSRVILGGNGRRIVNINGKDLVAEYVDKKVKEWNR